LPATATPGPSFWRAASQASVIGGQELVWFDAGYVMTGYRREVFFSADGRDWQRSEVPWTRAKVNGVQMDGNIRSIASSGQRVVAVGYVDQKPCEQILGDGGPPPCDHRPMAWVTDNGIDWVAGDPGGILIEAFPYQELQRIWPVGGGWDAAVGQPLILPEASSLAHSDDGLHWTALAPVPGSATGAAPAQHVDGVGSPDGRRIIWTFDESDAMVRLWRPDGAGWSAIADLGPEITLTASLGPAGDGKPWLIGGRNWGSDAPRLWISHDGVEFHDVLLPGGSDVQAGIASIVAWRGGFLALAGEGTLPAAVWSSVDGDQWTRELAMTEGWPYLQSLVVTASGLAAVHGSGPDDEDPYRLTVLVHE